MSERFKIVDVNPNDAVGGGGCACGPQKSEDCHPPFAVFYASETDSNLSPHIVVCQRCLESGAEACEARTAEALAEAIDVGFEELPDESDVPRV